MDTQPSWSGVGSGRLGGAEAGRFISIAPSVRRSPIHCLILCGVLLIAAIVIGTAVMVGNFRERALSSSERELENTVRLLTRHFDQQFDDTEVIAAATQAVWDQATGSGVTYQGDGHSTEHRFVWLRGVVQYGLGLFVLLFAVLWRK